MERIAQSRFIYLLAGIVALAGFLLGYDTGTVSGALLFIRDEFHLTPQMQGVLVSSSLLGAFFGALSSGRLSDHFGRKRMIITIGCVYAFGALWCAFADDIVNLILGRVMVGLAIGVSSYNAPLYIAEIAPAKNRGLLVSLNQLAITTGILVAFITDYALAETNAWRGMFALSVVPALFLVIGMFFLPETPRWLISKKRNEEALKVLSQLHTSQTAQIEFNSIKTTFKSEGKGGWKLLYQPWVKRALCIGIGLAVFQQVTGINAVLYYAPTIFESAGFGSAKIAILATVGIGIINVIMTIVALRLLDRWGRRPLLFLGLSGMCLMLTFLAINFAFPQFNGSMDIISLGSLMLYVAFFAVSMGPIFWLIISEIFPLEVRGLAMGISTMTNWGFNWLVALTFLSIVQVFGNAMAFFIFASMCVLGLVFSYYLVPETKGKTLEAIENELRGKVN